MQCYLERNMALARRLGDEEQATHFFREMIRLFLEAPEGVSAPWYAPHTARLLQEIYGLDFDRYKQEKMESNTFALAWMDQIRSSVTRAEDPILAALQYAILGNYIDFSALRGEVSFEELEEMFRSARNMPIPEDTYRTLRAQLAAAKQLLYITDNAGEIVFDRILAEEIQRQYPALRISFLVRGGPANNDALEEDAAAVGITFPVIGNGNCIPGTQLDQLSAEAKAAMDGADVIISKGQGNVETLLGCGYPIYYAFLVKCQRFMTMFDQPKLTPMLLREQDRK
jgi:uncharacterized protein with ATP-grasp and redox domains